MSFEPLDPGPYQQQLNEKVRQLLAAHDRAVRNSTLGDQARENLNSQPPGTAA